ncbi:MAG TPA: hypothetical protein VGU44_00250, partial [Gammaproteobacteria bacterium]|nr:hypothetical protein [Gammaproteobacteria bacterium]
MISAPALTQAIEEEKQKSDVNPNVGEAAFTLVTAGVQTTIKDSSLYRLVEDFFSENLVGAETKENSEFVVLLSAYRVEHHIDADMHKCWFIHFDAAPENHLFPGFELKERHLRIDARFANDNTLKAKRGLSRCHYTEEYVHPVTGEGKVVHVFIGENGYISYKIKTYKLDGTRDKDVRKDSGDAFLKKIIKNNAEPALALAKKLMDEKHDRYMKAEKKSYEIDAELNAIMQKILINSTQSSNRLVLKAKYGELVNLFLAEVAIMNRYNDQEIDERGVLLEQRYARMNRPEVVLEVAESTEVSESQVEPADSLENTQTAVVQESLSMKAKKIEMQLKQDSERAIVLVAEIKVSMDQLKNLVKKKIPLETPELISGHVLKNEVHEKLIELAFLPDIAKTKEHNAYVEEVAKALNDVPALLENFTLAVKLGELERVTQLYPHVQHENLEPIFYDLIFKRLVPSTGE